MAKEIAAFQEEIGESKRSPAVRALIELGLQKMAEPLETLRRAGYQQGVWVALQMMNKKLHEVMHSVLIDRDVNIERILREYSSDDA